MTATTLEIDELWIQPTGAALGADVFGVDISRPLPKSVKEGIAQAWNDHLVLRFSGQRLDDEQLMEFSRNFGELDATPLGTRTETSDLTSSERHVAIISNIKVQGVPIGNLGSGESEWHTDMSYNDVPPRASALYALEVPVSGGNTWFCNMYLAYETFPVRRSRESPGWCARTTPAPIAPVRCAAASRK